MVALASVAHRLQLTHASDRQRSPEMRTFPILFMLLTGSALPIIAADGARADQSSRPEWWGPTDEARLVFSVDGLRESDTGNGDVRSVRVAAGIWDLFPYDPQDHVPPGRWLAWLSYGSADEQALSRLGMDWGPFAPPWGPVRVGGYIRGGFEYRRSEPTQGFGGFLGLGVDLTLWVHPEWNLGLQASRNFGISAQTWNDLGFCVRYSPRKLSKALNP